MNMPNLIIINGPAGIGKTTIAHRYIEDHPLSLLASTDEFISNMGQWLMHEEEGRLLSFALLKGVIAQHLSAGYDVIVPQLLINSEDGAALEEIARQHGAVFYEFVLMAPKDEATARILERGTWGEAGAPPVTEADIPVIEELYDQMQATLAMRSGAVRIESVKDDIDSTYAALTNHLNLSD